MIWFKNLTLKGILINLAVLGVISWFIIAAAPQASGAVEPVVLTVTGDGVVKKVQFTMADLKALPQKTYTYSGYNHWPSLQIYKNMTGPTLKTILDTAALKDNATLIRVKLSGGVFSEFTKEQLLDEPRYYFPDGENPGDVVDWPPKRSERGKVLVETMLALNEENGKLIYGQRSPNEPTCCKNQMLGGICEGATIEVLTTPLEQWEVPHADQAPGTVAPGTKVTLQHRDGTPYHALVYYTLDGSEPTYGSFIFNISYPNFQPELNRPIPIDKNLTIKTKTIGMGKLDSEVATYQYNTGSPATTIKIKENTASKAEGLNKTKDKVTATVKPDHTKYFSDIEVHWAKEDINYLVEKGIIDGMTETEFKPEENITRAQFAKLLIIALNTKVNKSADLSFEDVPTDSWYHDYVSAAAKAGLIMGYDGNVFAPDENITREQMAVIISRALKMKSKAAIPDSADQLINKFIDKADISPWAEQEIALSVTSGIVNGMSEDTFAPQISATRAEAAAMILRLYKQLH